MRRGYERPWHKRRYGYYEKPSTLRRKQTRTVPRLYIGLEAQFRREGPSNAMGR
ncbi:MAG: hypothetical protein EHM39_09490 [Chloroflexi bacterium]|nr:MAG: hypothetical protein EHM39_09490 [Chloroflexota bacterium]